MDDLRNSPIYNAYPDPSSYDTHPRVMQSDGLPVGTQQTFVHALNAAEKSGSPLNILLSIRLAALLISNDPGSLGHLFIIQRIHVFVERLRKWMQRNSLPKFYIWVRERSASADEHLHLGLHVPRKHRASLVVFLEKQFQDPVRLAPRSAQVRTEGEFACSESGSWHLAADTRPERGGLFLAGYLGKGEPSEVTFRGALVGNRQKPIRGRVYGGQLASEEFDLSQGKILGTATRRERSYISKALQRAMRETAPSKR